MSNILLTSEKYIREMFEISDNVQSKFLLPTIRLAQEVKLKSVIGEPLLDKLKSLIEAGTINSSTNAAYKGLLDNCQIYLGYCTIVELCMTTTFKISNIGVYKHIDENMQTLDFKDVSAIRDYYEKKADSFCFFLQKYILEHRYDLKEVNVHQCNKIHSNLTSAASSNIWLGGARGRYMNANYHFGYDNK